MKIDFSMAIQDFDGKNVPVADSNNDIFTLGKAAVTALVTPLPNENEIVNPEERFRRGELASRIHNKKLVEMEVEEVALIKQLIGKVYTPLVVFRAWNLLK